MENGTCPLRSRGFRGGIGWSESGKRRAGILREWNGWMPFIRARKFNRNSHESHSVLTCATKDASNAKVKQLFKINLAGAVDVSNMDGLIPQRMQSRRPCFWIWCSC